MGLALSNQDNAKQSKAGPQIKANAVEIVPA